MSERCPFPSSASTKIATLLWMQKHWNMTFCCLSVTPRVLECHKHKKFPSTLKGHMPKGQHKTIDRLADACARRGPGHQFPQWFFISSTVFVCRFVCAIMFICELCKKVCLSQHGLSQHRGWTCGKTRSGMSLLMRRFLTFPQILPPPIVFKPVCWQPRNIERSSRIY